MKSLSCLHPGNRYDQIVIVKRGLPFFLILASQPELTIEAAVEEDVCPAIED